MLGEKLLRLFSGLFVGVYVARYLGPAQYGMLNYAISVVALVSSVASLGLDSLVVREIVRDDGTRRDRIMGTAFLLHLVATVVLYLLLLILVMQTENDERARHVIFVITIGSAFECFYVIEYFFQAKTKSKYVALCQAIALIIVSITRLMLVFTGAPLVWFAASYSLDFVCISLGLLFLYNRDFGLSHWKFDAAIARGILRDAWPLVIGSLSITIYMRIDQIMVRWMLGEEANGYYGVAVRLSELWNFIPMAICGSLFPAVLNAKVIDENLYTRRLQSLYSLMLLMSIGIAIPLTFLSDFVVTLLFSEAYLPAGNVLMLYVWSGVFTFLGVANGKWIVAENLLIFRMWSLISSCVLNIVLNLVLIPAIGLNGAAVATLLSYALATYFSFAVTQRTRPMFWLMTRLLLNPVNLVKSILKH